MKPKPTPEPSSAAPLLVYCAGIGGALGGALGSALSQIVAGTLMGAVLGLTIGVLLQANIRRPSE